MHHLLRTFCRLGLVNDERALCFSTGMSRGLQPRPRQPLAQPVLKRTASLTVRPGVQVVRTFRL